MVHHRGGCSCTTVASLEYEGRLFVASRRPERVLEHGEEGGAVFLPEERRHVVELDLLRLHVPRQPHLEPLEHGRALLVLAWELHRGAKMADEDVAIHPDGGVAQGKRNAAEKQRRHKPALPDGVEVVNQAPDSAAADAEC